MPNEIKAYECEHGCGKYLKSKSGIKKHEAHCFSNPSTKACQTCNHSRWHKYDPAQKCHVNFCAEATDWVPSEAYCEYWEFGVPE